MNNYEVSRNVFNTAPISSRTYDKSITDKLTNMLKRQQELLEKIEFYIFKFEKRKFDLLIHSKNKPFLGIKRNMINDNYIENNESFKIKNTINKLMEIPSSAVVRKRDKYLEKIKYEAETPEKKFELSKKNLFDLDFIKCFETNYQKNTSNEEFEFFFEKNNNLDDDDNNNEHEI